MFGLRKKANTTDIAPAVPMGRSLGLDINASRIRGVVVAQNQLRTLQLDSPAEDLPLVIRMDQSRIELGHKAAAEIRKIPHDVCTGYFALLGQSQEWRGSRHTINPNSATRLSLDAIREAVTYESRSVGVALPFYFSQTQVREFRTIAHECQIPVKGTVVSPLAIASHRAANVGSDGTALIVDADEYALSASLVAFAASEIRMIGAGLWPHLSLKIWKNRLIDTISDRCVRICRRDPRDSALAEQSLFDQLDVTLDAVRQGQKLNVTLRADHWFQDLPHTPEDFETYCQPLAGNAAENVQNLIASSSLSAPPRTIWLTHAASQLPGLAARIFRNSTEHTAIGMLPANATAEAVASLLPRWESARLDTAHQSVVLPWERLVSNSVSAPPELPPASKPRPHLPARKVQGGTDA